MSLADFSTVKANSTASGELCLAPRQMRMGEDTRGGGRGRGKGGGEQRRYLTTIHLDVGSVPLNVLTQGRTSEASKN